MSSAPSTWWTVNLPDHLSPSVSAVGLCLLLCKMPLQKLRGFNWKSENDCVLIERICYFANPHIGKWIHRNILGLPNVCELLLDQCY